MELIACAERRNVEGLVKSLYAMKDKKNTEKVVMEPCLYVAHSYVCKSLFAVQYHTVVQYGTVCSTVHFLGYEFCYGVFYYGVLLLWRDLGHGRTEVQRRGTSDCHGIIIYHSIDDHDVCGASRWSKGV
jgi:hypothetical protein